MPSQYKSMERTMTQPEVKFKKIGNATKPIFKIKPNGPEQFYRFDGYEMSDGKPQLINVTDMKTGEQGQLVVTPGMWESLVASSFIACGELLGKVFGVSITRVAAAKFSRVNLVEMEIDSACQAEQQAPEKPAEPSQDAEQVQQPVTAATDKTVKKAKAK